MKRLISWLVLLASMIILGSFLFVSGKQHKVFVKNGSRGMKNLPKVIEYSIDGSKFKKLKATKMGATNVKGRTHEIVIRFNDNEGQEKTIVKEFKTRLKEVETIDFIKIIDKKENWLEYRTPKPKKGKKD